MHTCRQAYLNPLRVPLSANAYTCFFSWTFMGLNQKNWAWVSQSLLFLAQSWTAVALLVVVWFPAAAFPSWLFIAINNLSWPFVSKGSGENVAMTLLLKVLVFMHLSNVLWILWSRRMKKFAERCILDHFGLDIDCSPSARLLVCTADRSSLLHCANQSGTISLRNLVKVSLYQANKHLQSLLLLFRHVLLD